MSLHYYTMDDLRLGRGGLLRKGWTIRQSQELGEALEHYRGLPVTKRKVLGIRRLGEGSVNAVSVTTRLIAEAALSLNASAVVLAHNHVSGLAFPSEDDIATTDSLAPFLARMGVELLDHLIFVDDDMVSLRDSGYYRP